MSAPAKKTTVLVFLSLLVSHLFAQETIQFKVDALAKNSARLADKERMDVLSGLYMDYQLETYPELGVFLGKPADNRRWTDLSFQAIEQRKKDRNTFLKGIQAINRSNLNRADQLSYDLLKNSLELEKQGERFPSELMPIDQMSGYHQQIMQVVRLTTFGECSRVQKKHFLHCFCRRLGFVFRKPGW